MTQQTGTVKWFNRLKGFGFIVPDEGTEEVFAHYANIEGEGYRNLSDGDRVSYTLVDVGKGAQARNIRQLNSAFTASEYEI